METIVFLLAAGLMLIWSVTTGSWTDDILDV